jgi:alkylated DNA repair dioxygenase AlkB
VGARTYYPRESHIFVETINDLLVEIVGDRYEGCFLNGYENERDALGWHADDDPNIDHGRSIAVVTVGAGRAIQFMEKEAGMQDTHLHRIPKVGRKVEPRISLTYRGLIA